MNEKHYFYVSNDLNYEKGDYLGRIYSANTVLKENDYVVIADEENKPQTAIVTQCAKVIDVYTCGYAVEDIITAIDMRDFYASLKKKHERYALEEAMDEQIARVKKMDTFKKLAEKDPEMNELYRRYLQLVEKPLESVKEDD